MNGGEKYVAGEVSIGYQGTMESDKRWILSLDLDSVYNAQEDGYLKEVYGLCPSNIDVTNKFRLITELFVRNTDLLGNEADRLLAKKESKPFLMRTEPRRNKSTVPESPGRRKYYSTQQAGILLIKLGHAQAFHTQFPTTNG